MMLPTFKLPMPPYDKSLHLNYGAAICAVFSILFACISLLDRSFIIFAPGLGFLMAWGIGKATEMRQDQINDKLVAAGQPPSHSVEEADVKYTAFGGLLVALPQYALILLMR